MTFAQHGKGTSGVEVKKLADSGFWLQLETEELFVPFSQFPWFEGVPIEILSEIERPHETHLYWPRLDVDLAVESLRHPEKFPLISRAARD